MLGFSSKFGSVKGMVLVPDLSVLLRSEVAQALSNIGLKSQELYSIDTSNSSLNNKATSQSVASGTLVDYDSTISYSYYRYVAPPPTGPVLVSTQRIITQGADRTTRTCSSYVETQTTYNTYIVSYKYTYSDGSTSTVLAPSENYELYYNSLTINNSSYCGYSAPSCMPTSYTTCSGCVNGYNSCSTTYVQSDCSTYTTNSSSCCSSTTTSYGAWSSCGCGQRTRTVTTTTTCGSSTTTSTSTQTSNCSGGPC